MTRYLIKTKDVETGYKYQYETYCLDVTKIYESLIEEHNPISDDEVIYSITCKKPKTIKSEELTARRENLTYGVIMTLFFEIGIFAIGLIVVMFVGLLGGLF